MSPKGTIDIQLLTMVDALAAIREVARRARLLTVRAEGTQTITFDLVSSASSSSPAAFVTCTFLARP